VALAPDSKWVRGIDSLPPNWWPPALPQPQKGVACVRGGPSFYPGPLRFTSMSRQYTPNPTVCMLASESGVSINNQRWLQRACVKQTEIIGTHNLSLSLPMWSMGLLRLSGAFKARWGMAYPGWDGIRGAAGACATHLLGPRSLLLQHGQVLARGAWRAPHVHVQLLVTKDLPVHSLRACQPVTPCSVQRNPAQQSTGRQRRHRLQCALHLTLYPMRALPRHLASRYTASNL
jgi:hypothetical protein